MTETRLPVTTQSTREKAELALLKAIGFDRLSPEERELALNIAARYDLDPMLGQIRIIDGRAYITRDGLLHVAHKSAAFDGIDVTPPVLDADGVMWRCNATVYRKDMSRPFTYPGRYPNAGRGKNRGEYAEEMAIKVAECMALRRAFDVAAPVLEERWMARDDDEAPTVEVPAGATLAERVAAQAEAIRDVEVRDDTLTVDFVDGKSMTVSVPPPAPVTPPADDGDPDEPPQMASRRRGRPPKARPITAVDADGTVDDVDEVVSFIAPPGGFNTSASFDAPADPSVLPGQESWTAGLPTEPDVVSVPTTVSPLRSSEAPAADDPRTPAMQHVADTIAATAKAPAMVACDNPSPYGGPPCADAAGHRGPHRNHDRESWT